jgi:predicted transcriptional regulator
MKAVLLSIRPKWCKKIANLQKTVEIRKTAPNLEVPFKCYIYCTKAPKKLITIFRDGEESYDGEIYHGNTKFITWDGIGVPDDIDSAMQMVIGEFTCDKIDKLVHVGTMMDINILTLDGWYKPAGELLQAACLTEAAAKKYLQGRNGYGWHISDLKIYNQPKDIICFHRAVEENELWCKKCAIGKKKDVHCAFCYGLDGLRLRRPPQSWCYVEELSNE